MNPPSPQTQTTMKAYRARQTHYHTEHLRIPTISLLLFLLLVWVVS